ncbi:MAG: polymer-forming cytoskeletal protein [Terracidiphilus sp.]|jgi:cytoskeletal protein CcmA (bactofilin family)
MSSSPGIEPVGRPHTIQPTAYQATIGKGLIVKGAITGTGALLIDGRVEGTINLPSECVTVGQNGKVISSMSANMSVCITARDIVVLGNISGSVSASDRVDIRSEGKLTGDVSASRISIEDGAYFKGGIDIRKPESKPATNTASPGPHYKMV